MHEVLVNRLGGLSLPRKSVVRLTDRPDMTLDVYRGRKTTMQQCNNSSSIFDILPRTTTFSERHCVFRGGAKVTSLLKFRVLTSLLTSRVSCLRPWARQKFLAHRIRISACFTWTDNSFLVHRIRISACFTWTENSYLTHVISPRTG